MSTFAAWLLTYALHSTLLLGLAWALSRLFSQASRRSSRPSLRLEEAVWRTALLGAVVTASLHLAVAGAGWQPALGSWALAPSAADSVSSVGVELASTRAEASSAPKLKLASMAPIAPAERSALSPALPAEVPSQATVAAPARALPALPRLPITALVLLWAVGTLALLARFALSHRGLRRRLQPRLEISGGTLFRLLARLAPQSGLRHPERVQLTCAHRLPVPVALGIRRPEICVPPRALSHLDPAAQETLLAHELGHLARRDPLWLNAVALLNCALFFQPLNWVARRRLRELSELLCDDWAVSRTGQPLTLARCLAEVAGWSLGSPAALLPAPGMADRPGQLARRVRRLLEAPPTAERALPRWLGAALGVLLLAVVAVAPGVSAANGIGDDEAEVPEAAAAPEPPSGEPAPNSSNSEPSAGEPSPNSSDIATDRHRADRRPGQAVLPPGRGLSAADRERIHAFREQSEALAARQDLSEEEIERRSEELAEQFERDLGPRIDEIVQRAAAAGARVDSEEIRRLQADAEAFAERFAQSPEMERLIAESLKAAERVELSEETIERLTRDAERFAAGFQLNEAEIERLARDAENFAKRFQLSNEELERIQRDALRAAGSAQLSREEIERFQSDTRRLADQVRLDPKTEADLKRLAVEMRGLEQRYRQELDALRRGLVEGTEGLRGLERDLAPLAPLAPLGPMAPPAPPAEAPPAAAPAPPPPAPPAKAPPAPQARLAPPPSHRSAPALAPRPGRPAPVLTPVPFGRPGQPAPALAPAPAGRPGRPVPVLTPALAVRPGQPAPALAPAPSGRPGRPAPVLAPVPFGRPGQPAPALAPAPALPRPAVAPPAPRRRANPVVAGRSEGVRAGVPGGIAGGVAGGVQGGVAGGVKGGVAGGIEGAVAEGVEGSEAETAPPSPR